MNIEMMANVTRRAIDDGFGPFFEVTGRQEFDFTLLFEDTILSILPSALLLLVAPVRILRLWKASRKVGASKVRNAKILLLSIFLSLQVANLVVWTLNDTLKTRTSIAAASISLVAALAVWALSYLEHTRSIRPSSILNAYLLLTVLLDATKVRTLWLRGNSSLVAGLASCIVGVKTLVLALESWEKRKILLSPYSEYPPEATSGLYSRSLFWWLNPLFLLGYRSVIRDIDVYPTDEDLQSDILRTRFQEKWAKRQSPHRHYELLLIMTRCMTGPLTAAVLPRLGMTFFRFMQPLLIKRVTTFVTEPDTQATMNQGWGLTAAYGLVYFGLASYRMVTMVRGALVTTIYSKTIDLSITSFDENAAITLMSTDVQRICDALPNIHEIWACPIEIALAIWFLYIEVGVAMVGTLIVAVVVVAAMFVISSRTGSAQKQWLSGIQTRVDVTAKALQSMRGIKMLGLIVRLSDNIRQLRIAEIRESLRARKLFGYGIMSGNTADVFAPGATFTIFVIAAIYNGQTLNVSSAYTALSLIALLAAPVGVLTFTFPPIMAAVGCFDRIQDYLLSATRHDHRLMMPTVSEPVGRVSHARVREVIGEADDIELTHMTSTSTKQPNSTTTMRNAKNTNINVTNLTLSWADSNTPIINDVSFELSTGITMLVGPVGCGKSSLLKGLLGEVPSSKGYIYTDSLQIAFVGQTPWIHDGTLRENIIGMSTFEHKFYSSVIHACALEHDFEEMPLNDLTHVGSAGTGLSGGQKLRVALARAVYSRRHILILDDVFSGLDARSEDRIFSRLLGKKGLLREMDATVLLATHAAHRLSYADNIIALDSTGSISEQGSFPELMKKGGYVSGLAARHAVEDENQVEGKAGLTKHSILNESAQLTAIDDLKRPVGDWSTYKFYFGAMGYGNALFFLALSLGYAFFHLFPDVWVKFWTSAIEVAGNSVNGKYLGVLFVLESLAMACLAGMGVYYFTKTVPASAQALHDSLLTTAKNAPLWFFTSTDVGQVINRFSQDLTVIDYELPMSFFQLSASTCIGSGRAILICLSAAYFAAIMPFIIGLLYLIQKFYLRTSRQIRLMELEAKAPLYLHFIESLNGLSTIRAFGWAPDFESRNLQLLDKSQRPFYMLFCIQRWLNLVLDLTVAGLAVLLMLLIVKLRTQIDPGLVGLALLNVMSFSLSLTNIVKHWTQLETSLGAVARIKTFVQHTTSEHLPSETTPTPSPWPSHGQITFTNLSASYNPSHLPPSLTNINLTIPPGQKLALIGRSGSGKSSFITTLFHMLEITTGTIHIDGVDLATLPRNHLRQNLSVIPQDPLFIHGTIRANLDPLSSFPDADAHLLSTLSTVGLETIVLHAGGLDVPMDPENLLSHGQRQLFCLARAIVNKSRSPILILDEATANVDLQTDQTMQRIIRDEFEGCTIIAVAHRLGTIMDFDRVVVLDRGRVVEDGVPGVLVEDEESWFRRLWDS